MKKNILVCIVLFLKLSLNAQNTIVIDTAGQTSTCDTARVVILFHKTGAFYGGNKFIAQLVPIIPFINLPTGNPIDISTGIVIPGAFLPAPYTSPNGSVILGSIPKGTPLGTYGVRVISTNPKDTSDYSQFPVVITQTPAQLNQITVDCLVDTARLTAPAAANSYLWSTGDTVRVINVKDPGEYSVKTTDFFGCTSNMSTTIEKNEIIKDCIGEALRLTASVTAESYTWTYGATTNSIVVSDTTKDKTGVLYALSTTNPRTCSSVTAYNSFCAIFKVSIYPNPSNGKFNVSISTDFPEVGINIYNTAGQLMYSNPDKKNTPYYDKQIDLRGISSGIYFIKFDTGDAVKIEKIFVQ